jgi:hypothetical protein
MTDSAKGKLAIDPTHCSASTADESAVNVFRDLSDQSVSGLQGLLVD